MMALRGVRVVEMAGLAPAPFAGMILADFGASVVRVDKPDQPPLDTLARNKRSIAVSLKSPSGVEIVRRLCSQADVIIEPYRPGVMEKLGLGPNVLMESNPRLVYARLTGFGQTGPLSHRAGHDINYLATAGLLSMLGRKGENPMAPINLLADFAGGSFSCVIGVLMALFERSKSGKGQIVDAAMVDGAAYLGSFLLASRKIGLWTGERGENMLDTGAPFYDTYKTSDGKYMSVGAIEPQFYTALLEGLGMSEADLPNQMDNSAWDDLRGKFAAIFATKSQKEWTQIFSTDACVEPVLSMEEASDHSHNTQRQVFHKHSSGEFEPMPAPRLSRTPGKPGSFGQPEIGEHTVEVLKELSFSQQDIQELMDNNTIAQSEPTSKL
ncbi:alpha-methylacyl-CoA racemase-like isoform X2 [Halichondria panicea]|uniref:alpha-methylacyl-CoA racemase-like isoform X2 n=1 Tax=Halichondria panicea TaxID=6063 RepID=UPI00312B499D